VGWNRYVKIMPSTKVEVDFWIHNISRVNGQPFLRGSIIRAVDILLNTDASGSGWGCIIYLPAKELASPSVLSENFKKINVIRKLRNWIDVYHSFRCENLWNIF